MEPVSVRVKTPAVPVRETSMVEPSSLTMVTTPDACVASARLAPPATPAPRASKGVAVGAVVSTTSSSVVTSFTVLPALSVTVAVTEYVASVRGLGESVPLVGTAALRSTLHVLSPAGVTVYVAPLTTTVSTSSTASAAVPVIVGSPLLVVSASTVGTAGAVVSIVISFVVPSVAE